MNRFIEIIDKDGRPQLWPVSLIGPCLTSVVSSAAHPGVIVSYKLIVTFLGLSCPLEIEYSTQDGLGKSYSALKQTLKVFNHPEAVPNAIPVWRPYDHA